MTKKLAKLLNISLFFQVDCAKKLEMLVLDHTHPTDHSLNSDFSCVLVLVSSLTAASGFSQALRISLYHYIYNPGSYSYIISYEFLFQFPKMDATDSPGAEKEWKLIDDFFKKMLMHGLPHWHVIELPG